MPPGDARDPRLGRMLGGHLPADQAHLRRLLRRKSPLHSSRAGRLRATAFVGHRSRPAAAGLTTAGERKQERPKFAQRQGRASDGITVHRHALDDDGGGVPVRDSRLPRQGAHLAATGSDAVQIRAERLRDQRRGWLPLAQSKDVSHLRQGPPRRRASARGPPRCAGRRSVRARPTRHQLARADHRRALASPTHTGSLNAC
jgi:hypothetical protein